MIEIRNEQYNYFTVEKQMTYLDTLYSIKE